MYMTPFMLFILGVLSTVFMEVLCLIVVAIIVNLRNKK